MIPLSFFLDLTAFVILLVAVYFLLYNNSLYIFFFQNILLAFIVGIIWFQIPYKEENIEDRYSLVHVFIVIDYYSSNRIGLSGVQFRV